MRSCIGFLDRSPYEQLLLTLVHIEHDIMLVKISMDGGADDGSHSGLIVEEGCHVVIIHAPIGFDESHFPVFG